MDVHTRRLRYFAAVAEELNFSRAAARIYVTQQTLSKQIRELEDEIGTELFLRTTRSVELTPAGRLLLVAARDLLTNFDLAVKAALRTGSGEQTMLKVGFVVGAALELTAPIMEEFRERYPDVRLELHEMAWADPSAGLASLETDVAFVRIPISVADLETEHLFIEPCVAAVHRGHRLARRSRLKVSDLIDEPIAVARTVDIAWRNFWTLSAYRGGRNPTTLIETASHTEEMEIVAAGVACNVTPAAAARYTPHAGVRFIPIDDVPGSAVAVAWRAGALTQVVEQFVQTVRSVRDRETEIVTAIENPHVRQMEPDPG